MRRRHYRSIIESGFIGAAGSTALGAMGGDVAVQGQRGIANVAKFAPTIGTVVGTSMVMEAAKGLDRAMGRRRRQ